MAQQQNSGMAERLSHNYLLSRPTHRPLNIVTDPNGQADPRNQMTIALPKAWLTSFHVSHSILSSWDLCLNGEQYRRQALLYAQRHTPHDTL
jgi:hypothetical protein